MRSETSADFGCDQKFAEVFADGNLSVAYFFVYCGANFDRGNITKPVDFTTEKRYNANAPTIGQHKPNLQEHCCDHITDHSAVWNTQKQWRQEGTKASFP